MRQVPDTQEVFLDPESDMSVIVEILEYVDIEDAEKAIKLVRSYLLCTLSTYRWDFRFHFDSLAHDNSAGSYQICDVFLPTESRTTPSSETPPFETPQPIILHGEQTVRKFNLTIEDRVCVFVALFRIRAKGVDMALTVNAPVAEDAHSNDAFLQNARQKFDLAAGSLKILDFDLFA